MVRFFRKFNKFKIKSRDLRRLIILNIFLFIFMFLFILLLLPTISPSFEVGAPNYSLSNIYGPNFSISGWINMSFDDESKDSLFSGDFSPGDLSNQDFTLGELLEVNPQYTYSCIPSDCENDYSLKSPNSISSDFGINYNKSEIIGLEFNGLVQSVNSFSMVFSSSFTDSSLTPQLLIDILDDEQVELGPSIPSGDFGSPNYGDYISNSQHGLATITTGNEYCNKMTIPPNPNIKVGAIVTRISGSGDAQFVMRVRDVSEQGSPDSNLLAWCTVSTNAPIGAIECIPRKDNNNLSLREEQEVFVCIEKSSESVGTSSYGLKHISGQNFSGYSGSEPGHNFEIFFRQGEYAPINTLTVNQDSVYNYGSIQGPLEDYVKIYLQERYNNNCTPNPCIVPIRLISGVDQNVGISGIIVEYTAGITNTINNTYFINESAPKITSNYQRLYLDGVNIKTPTSFRNYSFSLELKGEEVIDSKLIEVKNVPIINSLTPLSVASAFPTKFEVDVTSPQNVSVVSYKWEFYNAEGVVNRTEITNLNEVIYTYQSIGNYSLKVSVTDSRNLVSSRTFQIQVTSPKEMINITLNELKENVQGINSLISGFSDFEKSAILSALDLENVSSALDTLEEEYNDAITPSENLTELNRIILRLLTINVPQNIIVSFTATSFPFFIKPGSVDFDVLREIGGGSQNITDTDFYEQILAGWQENNLNVTFDYKEFSGSYHGNTRSIVKTFSFKINEKTNINYSYYLVFPNLDGIGFDRVMGQEGTFYYRTIPGGTNTQLKVYTVANVTFAQMPAFISPSIDKLGMGVIEDQEEEKDRMKTFIISLIILAVIGIIAYIFLYQFYKYKYEKHLFPNRNDLFNMVNYVNLAKKRGLGNKEIAENLKMSKWTSEQITYVMKKYEGKRTGMIELPMVSLLDKPKKKQNKKKLPKKGKMSQNFQNRNFSPKNPSNPRRY
ncbi:hypothetical protein K0A97_01870 [Patescibacteria group bacterium]|nr:hypothetical protein [Patescibacteria group bacterium]